MVQIFSQPTSTFALINDGARSAGGHGGLVVKIGCAGVRTRRDDTFSYVGLYVGKVTF
jgi:hypothetical protein